jgi:hypothetical protein
VSKKIGRQGRPWVARFFLTKYSQTGKNIPNHHNITQWPNSILNVHRIFQKALTYLTFSHLRPSKICPNWDFWFEKEPSGNPGTDPFHAKKLHLSGTELITMCHFQAERSTWLNFHPTHVKKGHLATPTQPRYKDKKTKDPFT